MGPHSDRGEQRDTRLRPALRRAVPWALLLLLLLHTAGATASEAPKSLAVLDFELRDLTLLPNTPEEIVRTAAVAPLLRDKLTGNSRLLLVEIDAAAQSEADHGVGYLFEHIDVAADLAARHGASYIAVGRVHKPSFLFAYLKVHLIDANDTTLIGDFVVEVKGQTPKALDGGVERLAEMISTTLGRRD